MRYSTEQHVDREAFRLAMRSFAGTVTVITTALDGHLHGMTATAVSSVTADPPTILIVVNRGTRSHPLITKGGSFVLNILAEGQEALAQLFAGKNDDQFRGVDHDPGQNGAPVIRGVAAHLDCEVVVEVTYGTHTIFVGRVVSAGASSRPPLVYHNGSYKVVIDADGAVAAA